MAFPTGWVSKCKLTIQAAQVAGTLTNFPVLLTEANLPIDMFDADGSNPADNGGGDIRFSSDVAGVTQLPCEVVSFVTNNNPGLGTAEIWVKVPSINAVTDTDIYIWYSNTGQTQPVASDPFGSQNVWDSDYLMVLHMTQTPSGANSLLDSTSNGYHFSPSTPFAANPSGKIGKAVDFTDSPYLTKTDVNPQLRPANLTVQMWANADTYNTFDVLSMKTNGGSWTLGWGMDFRSGTQLRWWINNYNSAPNGVDVNPLNSTSPVFYAGKYNGSMISLKMNSDAPVTVAYSTPITYDNDAVHVGFHTGGSAFDGRIDEYRLSKIARSDDWIATDYNNQNDPSTFVIPGVPSGGAPVANFSASIDNFEVDFTDTSSGSPTSWLWDFDDAGATSTDQHPTHIFSTSGVFSVTLTATNINGFTTKTRTLNISANPGSLDIVTSQKLTFETDDNRIAFKPNIIQDQNGRLIAFYQKQLTTGKQTGGEVTNPSGFNISVAGGTGRLNGVNKTWVGGSVVAAPTLFQLVYVDPLAVGNGLGITSDLNMTFTASIIPIAFVFSGASSIVRLLPIENKGNYIVARRQKSDGFGGWLWDNYEDVLNSGEDPSVLFNPGDDRIYITYKRNSVVYQRIIQVGSESNAWTLIPDYLEITGPTKVPDDFLNEIDITPSGAQVDKPITSTFTQIFQFPMDETINPRNALLSSGLKMANTRTDFGGSFAYTRLAGTKDFFNNPGYTFSAFIYLPLLRLTPSSPIFYFNTAFYEIYDSDNETLLESIPYFANIGSWKNVDAYDGQRVFLGFRGTYSVFSTGGNLTNLTLSPSERFAVDVFSNSLQSQEGNQKNVSATDLVREIMTSGIPIKATINITFNQIFDYETDNTINSRNALMASGIPIKKVTS